MKIFIKLLLTVIFMIGMFIIAWMLFNIMVSSNMMAAIIGIPIIYLAFIRAKRIYDRHEAKNQQPTLKFKEEIK